MNAKDLLPLIHPAINPKFSPNLHAWIRKQWKNTEPPIVVTNPVDGIRYVGIMFDDGWLHGSRINAVLCSGAKEKTWAIAPGHSMLANGIDHTFWDRYILDGRCAIDPEHQQVFIGDETRWLVVPAKGNQPERRECQWCGHHVQVKLDWTETVHKSEWVAA